ncbi:MAG TPA: hypothetical protein VLA91_07155 [Acidimicrobiia bacterium]|nr:hypothetical protein [Acidimicrobiia bacterium]
METHQDDPTSERRTHPWSSVSSEFSSLADHLRRVYNQVASEDGPTEAEIKDALVTLAGAWSQVGAALSTALDDPETRVRLKRAAGAFASALGAAITDLGAELDDGP